MTEEEKGMNEPKAKGGTSIVAWIILVVVAGAAGALIWYFSAF